VTFGSSGVLQIDLRELGASRAAKPLLRHVATTGLASVARSVVPTPADESGAFLVGLDDAGVVTYGGLTCPPRTGPLRSRWVRRCGLTLASAHFRSAV
jgi:hypothetical protein